MTTRLPRAMSADLRVLRPAPDPLTTSGWCCPGCGTLALFGAPMQWRDMAVTPEDHQQGIHRRMGLLCPGCGQIGQWEPADRAVLR